MNFLDVFAGIGGFRMGLENAGHTCIGHIEIDKYARASYKAIYDIKEEEFEGKDITEIEDFTELKGRYELLTGGFPCQSFSIAGRRKGFEDTRGTMFFYLAEILEQTKPPFFLFENVKGLLSHDKGRTFEVILQTLDGLGYDVQWQLLNSKDFGVPQNRERVYIAGHLRSGGRREILPLKRASGKDYGNGYSTTVTTRYRATGGETYIKSKETLLKLNNKKQAQTVYSTKGLACTLSANGGGQGGKTGLYAIPILTPDRLKKRQNGRRYKTDGEPMFTLTAQDRHGVIIGEKDDYSIKIKNCTKQGYQEAKPGDGINLAYPDSKTRRGRVGEGVSNTITANSNMGTLDWDGTEYRIRRLTPRECWRLQGFPDWAFDRAEGIGTSDAQLYKQAGNAVTVNVVEAIGRRLKEIEREDKE